MTALHWASKKGNGAITQFLIIQGLVDIDAEDVIGRTPLYLALENSNYDIV